MHVTLFAQLFTGISLYASQTAKSAGTALQVGILLGPLIAIMASAILGRRMGAYPRPARAYWLSMVILSATFVALMLSTFLPPATVVVLAVVSVCVFFVADLVASPTAIAFVTAVAPGMFASRLLSVHYVSFALGSAISGLIPAAMGEWGYRSAFAGLAASGLIGATLLWRYRSHIDVDSR
jgi:POT family proton-dependent oligopeptide transporter